MPKKTSKKTSGDNDLGMALLGLAKEIGGIGEELRPLYHIESVADHIGELASALQGLAKATALSVIANHGTADERAEAVKLLKRSFLDIET